MHAQELLELVNICLYISPKNVRNKEANNFFAFQNGVNNQKIQNNIAYFWIAM